MDWSSQLHPTRQAILASKHVRKPPPLKHPTLILLAPVLAGAAVLSLAVIGSRSPAFRNDCATWSLDANGVGVGGAGYAVMSFNIKGAQLSAASAGMAQHKGDYSWSTRGPQVLRYINNVNPDLLGLQENGIIPGSGKRQVTTLRAGLQGYRWLFADRPTPIAIRDSAFTVLDQGRVRLSTTGVMGATGNRWAVWVKLRATSDNTELLYVNLHAQHMQLKGAAKARSVGWSRLVTALKVINPGNQLPTIMTGDFNASSDESRAVFRDHLVKLGAAGFVDAAATGANIAPIARVASYNGWGDTIGGKWHYKAINRSSSGSHIDYVWTAGGARATTWQVYTGPTVIWKTINGEDVPFTDFVPSDHWPVLAKVAVGAGAVPNSSNTTTAITDATQVAGYKGVQLANAQQVVAAADKLGLDDWTAAVGIMTAMGESSLINVDHGDRVRNDTIGLFQTGPEWGAYTRRMDPYEAALLFFDRLQDVPGWREMTPTMAAHRAQRNADPNHYTKSWDAARQVLAWVRQNPALAGLGNDQECGTDANGPEVGPAGPLGACPPSGSPAENGLRSTAVYGLRCVKEAFPWLTSIGGRRSGSSSTCSFSDHCKGLANDLMIAQWSTVQGNARGWQVAKWVQAHARELNVTYVIFDAKVWRSYAPERGWARYSHPYGNSSPTLAHRDHVHVSYAPPE